MNKVHYWLSAAIIITIVFGTMYVTNQQVQRSGANDPQIQLAQYIATQLNQGGDPSTLSSDKTMIRGGLAPFVIIYDLRGVPIAGSGLIDNFPPAPSGMLQAAKGRDYNAVTWQPNPKTRIASVTVAANKYYVLSGRSLREVEKRENTTLHLSVLGWILSLFVLAFCFLLFRKRPKIKFWR